MTNRTNVETVLLAKKFYREQAVYWNDFRNMNAKYCDGMKDTEYNSYDLFKSYGTLVAMADHNACKVYEFGKYSRTTSKQISTWINTWYRGYERVLITDKEFNFPYGWQDCPDITIVNIKQ